VIADHIARTLEEAALKDPYFVDRKLYPNVDFYSGIIYRALGIPTNMFAVMFALAIEAANCGRRRLFPAVAWGSHPGFPAAFWA
jgi:hypothetical protein